MTRITLIGPVQPYRGGLAHFTSQLFNRLLENGENIQLISYRQQYPSWLYPGVSDKEPDTTATLDYASYIISPLNPFSWINTINEIKKFNPDKIIFQWWVTYWTPFFFFMLFFLRHYHLIIIAHCVLPHEEHFYDRWLARIGLFQGKNFIVFGKNEEKRLSNIIKKEINLKKSAFPVLPQFSSQKIDNYQAKKILKINTKIPMILFFGIVRKYKGLSDLIQAIKILNDRGIEITLMVAGELWDDKSKYEKLVVDNNLQQYVHFTNEYVKDRDVGLYFSAADVFVAPYRSGTQSAATKVALSFGLPVIITDVIEDPILKSLTDICEITPKARPDLLADSIVISLSKSRLEEREIKQLENRSWKDLINVITLM